MKVFVSRLTPMLPKLYTQAQHGFCPGRSRLTAVATLLPCFDQAHLQQRPLYGLALDLDKACDSVDRQRLD